MYAHFSFRIAGAVGLFTTVLITSAIGQGMCVTLYSKLGEHSVLDVDRDLNQIKNVRMCGKCG